MPDINVLLEQPDTQTAFSKLVGEITATKAAVEATKAEAKEEKPVAPGRDESGRFAAAPVKSEEKPVEKEKPAEKKEPEKDDAEYDAAIRDLRRLKAPESVMKLPREELLQWSKSYLRDHHDRNDKAYGELKELRTKKAPAQEAEVNADGLPGPGNQSADALDFKKLTEPFAKSLDPEAGAALEQFGMALHGHYSQKFAAHQGYLNTLVEMVEEMAYDKLRTELAATYPQAKEDEGWGRVVPKAERFARGVDENGESTYAKVATTPLGRLRAALFDAADSLFAKETAEAKVARDAAASRQKDSQTLTPSGGRIERNGAQTAEDAIKGVLFEKHPDFFSKFPRKAE